MGLDTTYTSAEAARLLGVSRNTLLRWFREGRIPHVDRDRNGWRIFRESDLARLRRELEAAPTPRPMEEGTRRMRSYLRRVPTFSQLTEEVLDRLAELARFKGLLRGQRLFVPGERSRGLYILVKGRVRVFRSSLEGREQTLTVAVPYQTLGESVLFRNYMRHNNQAVCMEGSTVILLPTAQLRQLTLQYPPLAHAFLREFSRRIEDLEGRLEEQVLLSLDQRLARFLREQVGPDSREVTLSMSLAEMASYLGVARESLSRCLVRLANDGLIVRSGRSIRLLDPEALDRR